jgi:hypothetical protein
MPGLSLTQLAARLPSVALARLLLALLLICNLTLCIGWHGVPQSLDSASRQTASLSHIMPMNGSEMADPMAVMDHQNTASNSLHLTHPNSASLSCHQGIGDEGPLSGECPSLAC